MYKGYTPLFMQFSKPVDYIHNPEWYYNFEYQEEMDRGYDYQEDLFVPGFFETEIKKGESIVFCAGTTEVNPVSIKRAFTAEVNKRTPRDNFENCLVNSAQQFIINRDNKTWVVAGFPWFGRWGRDTFIALPGLTLVNDDAKTCKAVIDSMIADLKGAEQALFIGLLERGSLAVDDVPDERRSEFAVEVLVVPLVLVAA